MSRKAKGRAKTVECPLLDPDASLFSRTKVELLRHHATKELTHLLQVDGFNPSTGLFDDLRDPDDDEVTSWRKHELMTGHNVVRILAKPGADAAVVVRILTKIADWIEREPEMLQKDYLAEPPEVPWVPDVNCVTPGDSVVSPLDPESTN